MEIASIVYAHVIHPCVCQIRGGLGQVFAWSPGPHAKPPKCPLCILSLYLLPFEANKMLSLYFVPVFMVFSLKNKIKTICYLCSDRALPFSLHYMDYSMLCIMFITMHVYGNDYGVKSKRVNSGKREKK